MSEVGCFLRAGHIFILPILLISYYFIGFCSATKFSLLILITTVFCRSHINFTNPSIQLITIFKGQEISIFLYLLVSTVSDGRPVLEKIPIMAEATEHSSTFFKGIASGYLLK